MDRKLLYAPVLNTSGAERSPLQEIVSRRRDCSALGSRCAVKDWFFLTLDASHSERLLGQFSKWSSESFRETLEKLPVVFVASRYFTYDATPRRDSAWKNCFSGVRREILRTEKRKREILEKSIRPREKLTLKKKMLNLYISNFQSLRSPCR